MRLQDEYIKRHKIAFNPIYYVKNANIILKHNSRPKIVVNFSLYTGISQPLYYVFGYLEPAHNSYLDGGYFTQVSYDHYYNYHEYPQFIARAWPWHCGFIPVKFEQVKLAVWEMFLYCFDGWIAERDLEEMAYRATDTSLSDKRRIEALDSFINYLEDYDSLTFDIYNSEFKKYECDYANWLVELMEVKNAGT